MGAFKGIAGMLTQLGQYVNEMMAVAMKNILIFDGPVFS